MIQKGIKLYIIVEGWPKFQLILITATLSKIKINIWIIFSETDYCKTLLQFCLSRREREKLVSVWATHKIMCEWIWSLEALLLSESTNFYGNLLHLVENITSRIGCWNGRQEFGFRIQYEDENLPLSEQKSSIFCTSKKFSSKGSKDTQLA